MNKMTMTRFTGNYMNPTLVTLIQMVAWMSILHSDDLGYKILLELFNYPSTQDVCGYVDQIVGGLS